jgi:hypothetical protein
MGPLEVFFIAIGITIALIGVARGYQKELGTTLIILVAIFVLTFLEERIINAFTTASGQLDIVIGNQNEDTNLFLTLLFQVTFIMAVFASYSGRTLDFPGRQAPPPQGTLLSLAVGALNGYLVAGTLWYYLDRFNYPVQTWGLVQLPLTPTGQAMVEFLPQRIFDSPAYWMLPVAALLLLRVRG